MKFLIIKPSSFGDVIHTFPAVDLLRLRFPDAEISWVVNSEYESLVRLFPPVDNVYCFERKKWNNPLNWRGFFSLIREIRNKKYDFSLDFQGLFRSGFLCYASGAKRRIGYRRSREMAHMFYSEKILTPSNLKHAADKNLFFVESLFQIAEDPPGTILKEQPEACKKAEYLVEKHELNSAGPLVAVGPCSRWPSKEWSAHKFAATLDVLAEKRPDARFWLLGTGEEQKKGEAVAAGCKRAKPVNLMGKTDFPTLIEMLRKSSVFLANDSGPMHLAGALNVPVVAFYGPTDPKLTGPFGENNRILSGKCDLMPCLSRVCPLKSRKCAESIDPESAAELVMGAIK